VFFLYSGKCRAAHLSCFYFGCVHCVGVVSFKNIGSSVTIRIDAYIRCEPTIYCFGTNDRTNTNCLGQLACELSCGCISFGLLCFDMCYYEGERHKA